MTDKFKAMNANDIVVMMEYLLKHQTSVSVKEVKKELGLTEAEYQELYDLCMPAVRMKNEVGYWRSQYSQFKLKISDIFQTHLSKGDKLNKVNDLLQFKSMNMEEKEKRVS